MGRSKWIIWAVVAVAVVGIAIAVNTGGGDPTGTGIKSGAITNDQFRQLQAAGARVVDVRSAGEYAMGYIPGALRATADGWDREEPIILYCATGSRSSYAYTALREMGFKAVYDLTQGIVAWDGAIDDGSTPPSEQSGAEATGTAGDQSAALPVMYEFYTDS